MAGPGVDARAGRFPIGMDDRRRRCRRRVLQRKACTAKANTCYAEHYSHALHHLTRFNIFRSPARARAHLKREFFSTKLYEANCDRGGVRQKRTLVTGSTDGCKRSEHLFYAMDLGRRAVRLSSARSVAKHLFHRVWITLNTCSTASFVRRTLVPPRLRLSSDAP